MLGRSLCDPLVELLWSGRTLDTPTGTLRLVLPVCAAGPIGVSRMLESPVGCDQTPSVSMSFVVFSLVMNPPIRVKANRTMPNKK